jgi:hypothetical protein
MRGAGLEQLAQVLNRKVCAAVSNIGAKEPCHQNYRPLHCAYNIDSIVAVYQDDWTPVRCRNNLASGCKSILTAPSDLHPETLDCGVERRPISTLHCGLSTVEQQGMMLDSRHSRRRDVALEPVLASQDALYETKPRAATLDSHADRASDALLSMCFSELAFYGSLE